MRSYILKLIGLILTMVLVSCAGVDLQQEEVGQSQQAITATNADALINTGRAKLGLYGGVCKEWVKTITHDSYGVWIPATDGTNYKWASDTTPAINVARWLGSYANGRLGPIASLTSGANASTTFSVSNNDPQTIMIYASVTNVAATMTKGSSSLSVTSSGTTPTGGTISSSTITGSGTWTLSIHNGSSSSATKVVAVVLSQSRFSSDWQTARRGDIIQLYGGTLSSDRSAGSPHTTFIQTDYNTNGSTSATSNWLDSNFAWPEDGIVRAHNITMQTMMNMMAYSSSYGFTIYRLN